MKCPDCGGKLLCYKTVTNDDGNRRRHYRRCERCGLLAHSDESLVVEDGDTRRSQAVTDLVLAELMNFGVAERNARDLIRYFSPVDIRYYLNSMDYIREVWKRKGKPIVNAPGFLVWAIRNCYHVEESEAQGETWYTTEEFERYFLH